MIRSSHHSLRILPVLLAAFLFLPGLGRGTANAQIPDLTKGGQPSPKTVPATALGPTGMLGWVYHVKGGDSSMSRQILVRQVVSGTPADGKVDVGDVILGAAGDGTEPAPFTYNALKGLADAITEAEARDPAELSLLVWRDGRTGKKVIELETMGAYSPTAPYNCPKSARILRNALKWIDEADRPTDKFGMNTLALLAVNHDRMPGNKERMKKAEKQIIEIMPEQKYYDQMVSDRIETNSKIAWNRTFELIVLAEYYLATGNNPRNGTTDLIGAIDAHAQTICRGQSMFGTMGHQFSVQLEDGSVNGPYAVGYGPINAVGLAAFYGLTLARDCKLPNRETNAAIDAAILRAANFFSSYTHQGTIPYGEHPAWTKGHAANGKAGLAAMALARVPGYEEAGHYFTKVAIAGGSQRVTSGHGGSFFNYLWSPLGANVGGVAAAAAHFREIRWHLELNRLPDGSFYYSDFNNPGYHGSWGDRKGYNETRVFRKARIEGYTPLFLVYALPLRTMVMTGSQPKIELSPKDVAEARFAANYSPAERTTEQLVRDLSVFSATVREQAAAQLAQQADLRELLPQLHKIAEDPNCPGYHGVFSALREIGDPSSASVLIARFADKDLLVRQSAKNAFAGLPRKVQLPKLDYLFKAAADCKRPPFEVDPDDPMNAQLESLIGLLFGEDGIVTQDFSLVDRYSSREAFRAAFRAAATIPSGTIRKSMKNLVENLPESEVFALGDTLLELVLVRSPADNMFAGDIRRAAVKVLLEHRVAEGIKASVALFNDDTRGGRWTRMVVLREWSKIGPSIMEWEGDAIKKALENFSDQELEQDKEILAKALKTKPKVKFTPLRELQRG